MGRVPASRTSLTSGAPEYNPLLTYSLTAKLRSERDAASSWPSVLCNWVPAAARARSRAPTSFSSLDTVVMEVW